MLFVIFIGLYNLLWYSIRDYLAGASLMDIFPRTNAYGVPTYRLRVTDSYYYSSPTDSAEGSTYTICAGAQGHVCINVRVADGGTGNEMRLIIPTRRRFFPTLNIAKFQVEVAQDHITVRDVLGQGILKVPIHAPLLIDRMRDGESSHVFGVSGARLAEVYCALDKEKAGLFDKTKSRSFSRLSTAVMSRFLPDEEYTKVLEEAGIVQYVIVGCIVVNPEPATLGGNCN